ncbi:MAG: HAMP domain-containing sensor histidine kinase [Bacteroidia bacterium]|nr:HAMP domain-containing sensor histidine kinase [Bacteroidia bacterium]
MSIRKKILLYFSVVTIVLVGAAFFFIYTQFYRYREYDFEQQQKEKIQTTLLFLNEIREIDEKLVCGIDLITINHLFDEKLLIFDVEKKLVYSSIDDTPITFSDNILAVLSPETRWFRQKDGRYDILGAYMEQNGQVYYVISKAYDLFGYHKLNYLKFIILLTFILISLVVIFMSYYLSKRITNPIISLTQHIKDFTFETGQKLRTVSDINTRNEVSILNQRFNELMQRMNEAFSFQKHAVHHISHELKTPIAILVSNFEKIESEKDITKIKELVRLQKEDTKSLGEIINTLLEIAKTESGNAPAYSPVRIDELIYDLTDELNVLYPEFQFSIEYSQITEDEDALTVLANQRLLKAALSNLIHNCIQYSSDKKAKIRITAEQKNLRIDFSNQGPVINEKERSYLFQHFFRGENSIGKRGFGFGLVFVQKILALYKGEIAYFSNNTNANRFTVTFPLS